MQDEHGNSKRFGYVNYAEQQSAELAARTMNRRMMNGLRIKVKGPKELESRKAGQQSSRRNPLIEHVHGGKIDYRPYTDCDFFGNGKTCTKNEKVSCDVYDVK